MLITTVAVDSIGPFAGRNIIEFSPGMNVVYGRNGAGKSILFRGMRSWSRPVDDIASLPGWTVDATEDSGAWLDVPRVVVEVDEEQDDAGAESFFLDDEGLARLLDGGVGPWQDGDDWIDALDIRFCHRMARMAGDDLERRNVTPALQWRDPGVILVGLESSPTGLKTIMAIALALALRDVRSPRMPLIIDDGGLGMQEQGRWP